MAMPVKEYEFPPKTYTDRKRNVAQVLWTVHLDGPFVDESGRATGMLLDALKKRRVPISPAVLNTILNDLDHPGATYGYFVQRKINGKRTKRIALQVDPYAVPFPKNPWPADVRAKFQAAGDAEAKVVDDGNDEGFDELEETFTRQALVTPNGTGAIPDEAEETEETLDVLDRLRAISAAGKNTDDDEPEEPMPSVEIETVEAARIAAEPVSMPNVSSILDGLNVGAHPVGMVGTSGELLTSAIGLISQAMTVRLQEDAARQEGTQQDVDRRIDERMAAYVSLIERNAELENKLHRSLQRERELVGLVRTLQSSLESLQRSSNGVPAG
jgi:hypothetical protein